MMTDRDAKLMEELRQLQKWMAKHPNHRIDWQKLMNGGKRDEA